MPETAPHNWSPLAAGLLFLFSASASGAWLELSQVGDYLGQLDDPREIRLAEREDLLRQGFSVPETWPGDEVRFVWANAATSRVRIPRTRLEPTRLTLRMAPHNCPGCPPQTAALTLNGHHLGALTLPPGGFADYPIVVPREVWRFGNNDLRIDWGRCDAPADTTPGSTDRRTLAAALVAIELRHPRRPRPRVDSPPILASGDDVLVGADQAATLVLRLPRSPGATLEGLVAREAAVSPAGASGLAVVSIATERGSEQVLVTRALAGLGTRDHPFSIDLSPFSGRLVRLSFRVEGSDVLPGLVARWSSVAIRAPGAERSWPEALAAYDPRPVILPPEAAPPEDPYNVILYLMDALRARDLGSYGSLRITSPTVDALSRRGALMADNTSQAPNTPPSVKALLTGRYIPHTGHLPLPPEIPTLAHLLEGAGFRRAIFSNTPWPWLVDAIGGFEHCPKDLFFDESRPVKNFAASITPRLLSWIDEAPSSPFFAYVHTIHPHNPYTPPAPWKDLVPAPEPSLPVSTQGLLEAQHGAREVDAEAFARLQELYDLDLLSNDHEIARIRRALIARGMGARTALAIVSDHGDEFGEHDGILHGWTGYSEMIETPVVLTAPGRVPEGRVVHTPTESVDVAPTLAVIAGLPGFPGSEGRTLLPLMEEAGSPPSPRITYSSASSVPGIYTIVDGAYKYVWAPRNGHEVGIGEGTARVRERYFLHDMASDPTEQRNIVRDRPLLAELLHRGLLSWLAATGGESAEAGPACRACTDEMREILEALGYLGE